jgi:hypothetical protein
VENAWWISVRFRGFASDRRDGFASSQNRRSSLVVGEGIGKFFVIQPTGTVRRVSLGVSEIAGDLGLESFKG